VTDYSVLLFGIVALWFLYWWCCW